MFAGSLASPCVSEAISLTEAIQIEVPIHATNGDRSTTGNQAESNPGTETGTGIGAGRGSGRGRASEAEAETGAGKGRGICTATATDRSGLSGTIIATGKGPSREAYGESDRRREDYRTPERAKPLSSELVSPLSDEESFMTALPP